MKPSAIIHMLIWGIASGALSGALLALLIITGSIDPDIPAFRVLLNLGTLLLMSTGASLGAAAGFFIGIANGFSMRFFESSFKPFTTKKQQRTLSLMVIPYFMVLVFFSSWGILQVFNMFLLFSDWFAAPLAGLSAFVAAYPAYRYLTRLRRWYMIQPSALAQTHAITHNHLTDSRHNIKKDDTVESSSQLVSSEKHS